MRMKISRKVTIPLALSAVSFSVLLLEITYTRVFSFKLYYYYSFFVLGLALLGLSIGSALLTRLPSLVDDKFDRTICLTALLAAFSVGFGYLNIVYVPTNINAFLRSWVEFLKILWLVGLTFLPFFCSGILIAAIFARQTVSLPRTYFFDLLGAGVASLVSIYAINALEPPGALFLAASVLAGVGLVASFKTLTADRIFLLAVPLTALLVSGTFYAHDLPAPLPDKANSLEPPVPTYQKPRYSRWNAIYRVDVVGAGNDQGAQNADPNLFWIYHEGIQSSAFHRFNGLESLDWMEDKWGLSLPVKAAPDHPRTLVVGAAGGREMLASLYFGAKTVTGVELNPVYRRMLEGPFASFTGNFVEHPRIDYRIEEGRSYLSRSDKQFDLIYFVSPDSYASRQIATSGAFVMSESYLYTVEAIRAALEGLTSDGVLAVQLGENQFNTSPVRTPRTLSIARAALQLGSLEELQKRTLVLRNNKNPFAQWGVILLFKKQPFTANETDQIIRAVKGFENIRLFHSGNLEPEHPALKPLTLPSKQLKTWWHKYPYKVEPVYDNSPFFWNVTRFTDVVQNALGFSSQSTSAIGLIRGRGEVMLLLLLGFSAVLGGLLSVWFFPPFTRSGLTLLTRYTSTLFFALIGLGFMFYEVALIQKFTLFLGYPTYSLSICLATLLLATGMGSLTVRKIDGKIRTLGIGLMIIIVVTAGFIGGLPVIKAYLLKVPLFQKILFSIGLIAPLGFALGFFLPTGLTWLSEAGQDDTKTIPWGWAVNGYFSILASVGGTILAMSFNFSLLMILAMVLYALATLVLIADRRGAIV